jgi:hypothetical protein
MREIPIFRPLKLNCRLVEGGEMEEAARVRV